MRKPDGWNCWDDDAEKCFEAFNAHDGEAGYCLVHDWAPFMASDIASTAREIGREYRERRDRIALEAVLGSSE